MGLVSVLKEEGRQEGLQQGVQQGIQQGVQQGVQQGIQQGRCALLERILTRRFGTLPDWAQQQLKAASSEQLDRWAERVLEAESLQGVINDLNR